VRDESTAIPAVADMFSFHRKKSSDDEMDVDEEEEEEDDIEASDDEEKSAMEDDNDETGNGEKKRKRKKRRKSELDMAALGDEQAAVAALESTELIKLRLTKKYCAEALNFVRQIDSAMPTLGDLLGSKSKPEVLETIEFFRVAYEYKFEGAEVLSKHNRGYHLLTPWLLDRDPQDAASHLVQRCQCHIRGW
jgi:condensin complex subunit 1